MLRRRHVVILLNPYSYLFSQAYKTSWGLKCPGNMRGKLLNKLADLIEANAEEFSALEALDVGEYIPLLQFDIIWVNVTIIYDC
jgi:hypothetical protein